MNNDYSEQEQVRRDSLEEIIKLGINPYPPELFEVTVSADYCRHKSRRK